MLVYYLAEIDLPNTSAYALHVLKMCDALAQNCKVTLILFSKNRISFSKIKRDFFLKNNFRIIYYSSKKNKKNFFYRVKFAFFCNKLVDNNSLIISRSIISSMYLAFCKKFNYLEIHHNLTGISKILFFFKDFFFKRIFFILIHKNLKKILSINKHYIILDDAVDINNFKKKKKIKFTFSYLGSLYEGKGIEVVVDLAKEFPDYDFNIFGDIKSADIKIVNLIKKNKINNLKLHNHVNYFSAVKIIQASRYLLMPYLRKVMVRSKNLEVSNFMSPLKMFDYLASGNVLIASNLPVYSHILKNNYNCILADPDNFLDWKKKILLLLNNKINCNIIKKNALLTASKYTWIKRTKNILKNYKDKKLV